MQITKETTTFAAGLFNKQSAAPDGTNKSQGHGQRFMKTLDEIINRQDYVRVNETLAKRAKELAPIFAKKFYELTGFAWRKTNEYPEYAIEVNGNLYCAKVSKTVGVRIEEVRFVRFYDKTLYNEATLMRQYKYTDLYNATHNEYVDFLNDAKDILAKLDETESELVKESEEALVNAKNID